MEDLKKLLCCSDERLFADPYNFHFGSAEDLPTNQLLFETNFVSTSKYRWYTFLPKSLLLQFQRLANIYFLVIAILQTIPAISPLGPLTAWAPLIVVLGISILRQGYEDYKRYQSDHNLNHEQKTQILRNGGLEVVEWSKVVVGDICYVLDDQSFPADMVLLSSAFPDGRAFIETASLDGQKNLKPRSAFQQTQVYNSLQQLLDFKGEFLGIPPDKELHEFNSTLKLTTTEISFRKDKQLLYREAKLKNTKWIYGLVIYTGRNSKIMMNSQGETNKMSQIEHKVNYILAVILILQIVLCIILGALDGAFLKNNSNSHNYIQWGSNSAVGDGFLMFCTYLVLLNTMIPISLIVSIEIVKMSQSYFIVNDKFMYSAFRKKGPKVNSASLNEQLGQIEYVFTDKTGTLTTNHMELKIALIGKRLFGDIGLIAKDVPQQKGQEFEDAQLQKLLSKGVENEYIATFSAKNKENTYTHEINNQKELAHQYFTALSVAHEVVLAEKKGKLEYQGPSPDETALVRAAKLMGYEFVASTQKSAVITINKVEKQFHVLESFAFTSDRKRMSVIVRDNGRIKMYIKGADNIINARLATSQTFNLDYELDKFSTKGLRTLLIAMRYISQEEYAKFKQDCSALPLQTKQKGMQPLISSLQENLYVIGATAVLDRLQDQVPQTIRDLIRANVKVWMLTGDKMETAQNIARSCNLIQSSFVVIRHECKSKDAEVIHKELLKLIEKAKKESQDDKKVSLLIEGPDLTPIMGVGQLEKDIAELSIYCESVVCCRLLPAQKADVVRVVRQQLNKITLSIGDGANDVPMIKQAHIGIGLIGEQGMGAVLASDYALPEFRMLWRLLLVHGRWNYMRIAEMILYFFYKNMLFTIPQFVFAFFCAYSGQTIFDDIYISMYNLIFTSFPLIIRAIFEQDVNYIRPTKEKEEGDVSGSANAIQNHHNHVLQTQYSPFVPPNYEINKYIYRIFPKMYFVGQENCIFNVKNFALWTLQGAIEAVLISMFSMYILSTASISQSGYNGDVWLVSLTIFTSVMMLVTFKLSTHTKFWSFILFFSIIVLSLGLYFAYMWISNYYFSPYVIGNTYMFFTEAETYFIVLFCICFVLCVDGIVLSFDSKYSGVINKMRILISGQKEANYSSYQKQSIQMTIKTANPQQ